MLWKQCADCGHVFTEGYFTDEACSQIFNKTHQHQLAGFDYENQRYVASRIIEKVLSYIDQGPWLDVGFGNASLLFTAEEYGFTPIGLDLRENNVARLKALGIQAYCRDLLNVTLDKKCSVISMADVLEHMPYPKQGLDAAHKLLADDGIIFVSMPNMGSMLWKAFDQAKQNPYWGEIEHYHNFSRERLYQLLNETGFTPIRYGISERYRACMEIIARKKN
ncbi:MAG: class I SAM-dependent methyltransferase [Gammaproteobacteria bacterium]|nr:class I SAM-dependent methyltransferase [Gammaproteobacteria bacterium]